MTHSHLILDVKVEMLTKFADLPLSASVQASLNECGFVTPSPIQAKALPVALFGNDVIAQAKSGMGKTLVFACVTIELLLRSKLSWGLILAPTREIALQIQHVVHNLISRIQGLKTSMVIACIGGMSISDDERNIQDKSTRVIVGTPGRVKALVERKVIPMSSMHLFVLDEVDKLMESDFKPDIDFIVEKLPTTKQIVACSATFTPDQLARLGQFMHSPQFVQVTGPQTVKTEFIEESKDASAWKARDDAERPELWLRGVRQFYCTTTDDGTAENIMRAKVHRLASLLTGLPFHQCIVFCNDKYRAEALTAALVALNYPAVCITGAQAQTQRTESMESFRDFHARILVSTDLVARGIDVERVNVVINLDLPRDPATYLHRVGRSGRFGGEGVAVTLLNESEVAAIQTLAKYLQMPMNEWTGKPTDREDKKESEEDEYAKSDLPDSIFVKRKIEDAPKEKPTLVGRVASSKIQKPLYRPFPGIKHTDRHYKNDGTRLHDRNPFSPVSRKAIAKSNTNPSTKLCPVADFMFEKEESIFESWIKQIHI
ncbi:unnamed protein product [Aphanomyces euteiches]